jgi:hypothetical protein
VSTIASQKRPPAFGPSFDVAGPERSSPTSFKAPYAYSTLCNRHAVRLSPQNDVTWPGLAARAAKKTALFGAVLSSRLPKRGVDALRHRKVDQVLLGYLYSGAAFS